MVVDFTPEQEAQLSLVAAYEGTDTARLVKNAALRLLEQRQSFQNNVREGIEQADRGELIDDEEVRSWLESRERV
jgi:predicted transcriptional regulator